MKWVLKHKHLQMFGLIINNYEYFFTNEVVCRYRDPQLQVGEKLLKLDHFIVKGLIAVFSLSTEKSEWHDQVVTSLAAILNVILNNWKWSMVPAWHHSDYNSTIYPYHNQQ